MNNTSGNKSIKRKAEVMLHHNCKLITQNDLKPKHEFKHLCVICLTTFSCYGGRCTRKFLTQCDTCLISIPLRYYKDLPL